MKRAPPFGFEIVVDYKRIFRSWHIGAVKTVLISGERADSVAHGSVLLGVAEFHVLPVHFPYQSTDSVGDDERVRRIVQHGLAFGVDRRIAQDFLADEHDARYVLDLVDAVEEMSDLFLRRVAVIRRPQDDVEAVVADGLGVGAEDTQVDIA